MNQEEMKHEALDRIAALQEAFGLGDKLGRYFEDGKLYYSYAYSMDTINYHPEYAQAVKKFEESYGFLVYHAVEAKTNFGTMLSFLYVSSNEDDWWIERLDGDRISSYSFLVDKDWDYGEFGDILLAAPMGYLMRVG